LKKEAPDGAPTGMDAKRTHDLVFLAALSLFNRHFCFLP
jgi:hypothetical protein